MESFPRQYPPFCWSPCAPCCCWGGDGTSRADEPEIVPGCPPFSGWTVLKALPRRLTGLPQAQYSLGFLTLCPRSLWTSEGGAQGLSWPRLSGSLQAAGPPSATPQVHPPPPDLCWAPSSPGAQRATQGATHQSQLAHSWSGLPGGGLLWPQQHHPASPHTGSPQWFQSWTLNSGAVSGTGRLPEAGGIAPFSQRHPKDPSSGLFGR